MILPVFIAALLVERQKILVIKCLFSILLLAISYAARSFILIIFLIPLLLYFNGYLKLNKKIILLGVALSFLFILGISKLQGRSDEGNIFSLVTESIVQAVEYYKYSPYIFDLDLSENQNIDLGFALFGAISTKMGAFFGYDNSILINEFFTKEYDLAPYTGRWTPANVFHSWPSLLYLGGGLGLCFFGGILNGLIISSSRIIGGPVTYTFILYIFAIGSLFTFPLFRFSIFISIIFSLLIDKKLIRKT
jgi:hypothetical protein